MKKVTLIIIVLAVSVVYSACGGGGTPTQVSIDQLKLVRLDGTELNLSDRPIPRRVSLKATLSAAVTDTDVRQALEDAVVLKSAAGTIVTGTFAWSSDSQSVTFTPDHALDYRTTYEVDIDTANLPTLSLAKLTAEDITSFTTMTARDVNGDGFADALMSAPNATVGVLQPGQAYLFLGGGSFAGDHLTSDATSTFTGADSGDLFGLSLNTAGDVNADGYADIIIGALEAKVGSIAVGQAYLFLGSGAGIASCDFTSTCTPAATFSGAETDGLFGAAVSSAGDINDDGYDDIIIGAPEEAAGNGRVYLYHGGPALTGELDSSQANTSIEGEADKSLHGEEVATAGDVNGDGIDDIVIGAPELDSDTRNGKVYIFAGAAGGIESCKVGTTCTVVATIAAQAANDDDYVGSSVAGGSDINGDGYDDILVGAPNSAGGRGRAHLFAGGPALSGTINTATSIATIAGLDINDSLGSSVAFAGDTNGDGVHDIIVGARENPVTEAGYACVFHGGAGFTGALTFSDAAACLYNGQIGGQVGESVNTADDLNGDGYDDVLIGGKGVNGSGIQRGRVYVLPGSDTGIGDCDLTTCTPFATVTGMNDGDWLAIVK